MEKWHAAKPGSVEKGGRLADGKVSADKASAKAAPAPQYTEVFGQALVEEARRDPRVIGITAAMAGGTGLSALARELPDHYYDVGIAEQHAVTFAGGLACEGLKPVVAIYSTFLQRAYDQLIHDVALQNLPVLFAIDRAGIVGADGATHMGAFDLSYLRCLPNTTVMAPGDEDECRQMLYTGYTIEGPSAVRYPRGSGPGVVPRTEMRALPIGKGEIRREAKRRTNRIAILAFGGVLHQALAAAEEIDATLANMRFVKPLDVELIGALVREHDALVTVEENVVAGGAGSGVAEALAAEGMVIPILHLGLPDRFIDHGDPAQLLAECGLDARGIVAAVLARFGQRRQDARAKPAA
jgi:1-deoxy-D-xylulose-5-phosphate synthase